jgi:hypothetical protein
MVAYSSNRGDINDTPPQVFKLFAQSNLSNLQQKPAQVSTLEGVHIIARNLAVVIEEHAVVDAILHHASSDNCPSTKSRSVDNSSGFLDSATSSRESSRRFKNLFRPFLIAD